MLQVPLACACVVFVPLLFLNDEPDDASWELVQNVLVFLSTCALLASISVLARADASAGKPGGKRATPFCAAGAAAFSLGLFAGWLAGQVAYDMGGASGWAFRMGVTACIALLVSVILVAGMRPGHGDLPTSAERSGNTVTHGQAGGASRDKQEMGPVSPGSVEPAPAPHLGAGAATGGQPGPAGDPQSPSIEIAGGERGTLGSRPSRTPADDSGRPDMRIAAIDRVTHRYGLSEREHALLVLLAEGLTAQQAAGRLTVSRNTVKSHMAHIYAKCGVHTRAELNELLDG